MAQQTATSGNNQQLQNIGKHLAALTLTARLLLTVSKDPTFTLTSSETSALADLMIDKSAAILVELQESGG